jgi:hypothetical protein
LQDLAYDYIFGTNGGIRTVVGFDVHTSTGNGAILSIWRAVYEEGNVTVTCESTVGRNHLLAVNVSDLIPSSRRFAVRLESKTPIRKLGYA